MNIVILSGSLSRPPEARQLPSGDTVVDYQVTVPPRPGHRAESVPVVWPDAPGTAVGLEPDTDVVVVGRVRRRFFTAAGRTSSRTEVVASQVIPARQRARARRVVQAAVACVEVGEGAA